VYEQNDKVVWVEEGKLYRWDGVLLENPSILIYGGVALRVGEYTQLFKEMLDLEIQGVTGSEGLKLNLLNLAKYPKEYFGVEDACYVIKRCCEYNDDKFVHEVVEKYGNVGFLEWLEEEKVRFPLDIK